MTIPQATDFLVDTPNPDALQACLGQLPNAVVLLGKSSIDGPYKQVDGHYVMRVLAGDPGFVRFACENQGYCTIVRQLDDLVVLNG